jgi:autotransporter family porin
MPAKPFVLELVPLEPEVPALDTPVLPLDPVLSALDPPVVPLAPPAEPLEPLLPDGDAVVPAPPPPFASWESNLLLGLELQPPSESAPPSARATMNVFMI